MLMLYIAGVRGFETYSTALTSTFLVMELCGTLSSIEQCIRVSDPA